MQSNVFLPLLLVIPFVGALACALVPSRTAAKTIALGTSLVTALVAAVLAFQFPWRDGGELVFRSDLLYLQAIGFGVSLGADAVSLWLVLLTVLLQPLAIAASFESIREREKEYYAWMLVLLAAMLGVFVSTDVLLFYVFFELTLIPMFFIIGIWGGPDRRYAAAKFFLFTFAGSVFTLAGVVYLGIHAGSFDIERVTNFAREALTDRQRLLVLLSFLAGFAVKVPLFPVHTWLPLAHTEAPTAGSVILAGVLLKLGTYGLYKLAIPIGLLGAGGVVAFPRLVAGIGVVCLIGIIYGALVAWVQQDIKKLVAYSSVSHLGFCVLGLFALNDVGVGGSVLYMINHGLSTGALFLVIGMIYDRYHTRDINELSGLARRMPVLAFFFVLFTMSSVGLPGTNGFVSEFLTILGAFTSGYLGIGFGAVAATGIVLGAIYMLHMAARVIWGPLKTPAVDHAHDHEQTAAGQTASPGHDHHGHDDHGAPGDINGREIAILVPLAVLVVGLGLMPNLVLKTIEPSIRQITHADQPAAQPKRVAGAAEMAAAEVVGAGTGSAAEIE